MAAKKVMRPYGGDHNLMYEMRKVLDELGVGEGESFVVASESRDERFENPAEDSMGPFTPDSETSRKAALDNYPRSGSQRWRVLTALARRGSKGATRDELALALNLPDSSTDARVWELLQGDFVEATDRTRKTAHGSDAAVLLLTAKGEREVKERDGIDAGVLF